MRLNWILSISFLCPALSLNAQVIYHSTPDWVSDDTPYSTGAALVDLDQDGWLDFVVANGNDIRREKLVVYYNNGDGTLPTAPSWSSSDFEYNGHISMADVNADGWLDVAVGLTQDDPGTATARVYLNNAGVLSGLPDWNSHDEVGAFHVAFGDVNGDGRPDLAVGTGFPYNGSHRWRNYVYLNVGGVLESSPSWISADRWDFMDVLFCDVNDDGWLDLVGLGTNTDTWVYLNTAGTLATTATWHTTDNAGQFSVMGTYGDVDDDGWFDLFTTDNTQLFAGSGNIRRYDGLAGGLFTTTPTWEYFEGYGSAVALADIDADGDLDLASGGWWGRTRYFLNTDGLFPSEPDWSSGGATSVVEAICFGDVNGDGLRELTDVFDATVSPGRHLYNLAHQPIDRIEEVTVDGLALGPDEFTYDLVHGWVSVGPEPATSVAVRYVFTVKPDMAVTNWDNQGNQLYYNLTGPGDFDGDGNVDADDFDQFELCFTGPDGGPVTVDCFPGDIDQDDDIDCADWNLFLALWTVPEDPPEFSGCILSAPLAAPFPHDARKNRYISIAPGNDGFSVALQVEMTASVAYPGSTGVLGWVGEPEANNVSRVVSDPFFSDAWPVVVYVGDCEIVPAATYDVRGTVDALAFTLPLEIGTIHKPGARHYGDTVGEGTGDLTPLLGFTPPNGVVNVTDVQAYLLTQRGDPAFSSVHATWVDLHGLGDGVPPNFILSIADLQRILFGFDGQEYSGAPDHLAPADCP